ncbi:hypothetical protein [Extibacter muris]|nr:hypothetical protein [Extibacter muris]MCU0080090.1 hypothetical protein [Extibacter muris]
MTNSFAGEQYLYASLRILSQDEKRFARYERRMAYFEEKPEERADIQYELTRLESGRAIITYLRSSTIEMRLRCLTSGATG